MKSSTASSSSTTRILRLAMAAPILRGRLGRRRGALDEAQLGAVEVPAHRGDLVRELERIALGGGALDQAALRAGPLEAVEREAAGELVREAPRAGAIAAAERGADLVERLT